MGLVDYAGSDSESDENGSSGDDMAPQTSSVLKKKQSQAPESVADDLPDNFFDEKLSTQEGGMGVFSSLPSVVESSTVAETRSGEEGELEAIVRPKDWEKKLAEKIRHKLEKKAVKRAMKKKRREERRAAKTKSNGENAGPVSVAAAKPKKAKIAAFGALSALVSSSDDEEDDKKAVPVAPPAKSGTGLLSMLPAPKTSLGAKKLGVLGELSTASLVPTSLRNKRPADSTPKVSTVPAKRTLVPDSDSDDEEGGGAGDFFGLASASKPARPIVVAKSAIPMMSSEGLADADAYAPTRPLPGEQFAGYGDEDEEAEDLPSTSAAATSHSKLKTIDDKEAAKLIYRSEYAPWGVDKYAATIAASNIVDVNVDQALGDSAEIRASILRNMTYKASTRSAVPLPKASDGADPNAKRKHQITYLAKVAVAREEQLQEQWSQNKQMKRQTRQKYGF